MWSSHVLPVFAGVLSGCSGFLPQSKRYAVTRVTLIGHSKLPIGSSPPANLKKGREWMDGLFPLV